LSKKILMILGHDPIVPYEDGRVIKEAVSLTELGHRITLIAWSNQEPKKLIYKNIEIFRTGIINYEKSIYSKLISKLIAISSSFETVLGRNFDIIHCHDFETLGFGCLIKVLCRKQLVYDAHELEIGRNRPLPITKLIKVFESLFLRAVDSLITVNNERLGLMKMIYGMHKMRTFVIRNFSDVPEKDQPISLLEGPVDKRFIWLSIVGDINETKPFANFIIAVRENPHIKILYFGKFWPKILELVEQCKLKNVLNGGIVSRDVLISSLQRLDGSVIAFSQHPLNVRFCESNRVYETLSCGNFVIATKNPTLSFIGENDLGYNVTPKLSEIDEVYRRLDRQLVDKLKDNCKDFSKNVLWENNIPVLRELYGPRNLDEPQRNQR
jgi:hypothetical protein